MRIICCYTELHPATKAALPPEAVLEYTGADDFAYWRAIGERWDGSGDLVVIEHDIVIHEQVLSQFACCGSAWCTFAYPHPECGQLLTQSLGCVKFSAECQRFPVAEKAAEFAVANGLPPEPPWHSCDTYITRALVTAGFESCVHAPPVAHHHRELQQVA